MISRIVFILIFLNFIRLEYAKTRSLFIKAKVFHFITILIMLVYFSDAVTKTIDLVVSFSKVNSVLNGDLGITYSFINTINYIYELVVRILLLYTIVGLVYQDEKTRKIFVNFILFLIPSTTITLFMIHQQKGGADPLFFFLYDLAGSFLFFGSLSYIYRRKFMIVFFNSKGS